MLTKSQIVDINAEFRGLNMEEIMENAGTEVCKYLLKEYGKNRVFQIFCGPGNNGGDGFVLARKLYEHKQKVEIYEVKESKSKLAKKQKEKLNKKLFKNFDKIKFSEKNIIVDCILGVGIQGEIRPEFKEIIEKLNKSAGTKVSVDVASGNMFDAEVVLSLDESKKENEKHKEVVLDIGIPEDLKMTVGPGDIQANFPKKNCKSHKGQNGRLLIIGGSKDFHGAPLLAASGAEAIGVDLTTIWVSAEHLEVSKQFSPWNFVKSFKKDHLTTKDVKEILEYAKNCDACVIGPGLGKESGTQKAIIEILEEIEIPCVIDADAILAVKNYKKLPENSIFTPHSGEFLRLTDEEFEENIQKLSELKNKKNLKILWKNQNIILKKGATDHIISKFAVKKNICGASNLTRGGTGDFLAGMCGALLARGVRNWEAAQMAVFLLGCAAEKLEKKYADRLDVKKLQKGVGKVIGKIM